MATAATVLASVRAGTGQVYADGSGPVTDAQILAWANEEYPLARRLVALICPDRFRTVSSALVVASGAVEIDVSGLSGLDTIFEVTRLAEGGASPARYFSVDQAGPDPEASPRRCWRRRGESGAGAAVELFPVAMAPGTYRVHYMATAPDLTGT